LRERCSIWFRYECLSTGEVLHHRPKYCFLTIGLSFVQEAQAKTNMKYLKYLYLSGITLFLGACNVIDQEPIDSVSNQQLFTRGADAQAAIIGAYRAVLDNGVNYMVMAELPTKNVRGNALNRQFEQINNL